MCQQGDDFKLEMSAALEPEDTDKDGQVAILMRIERIRQNHPVIQSQWNCPRHAVSHITFVYSATVICYYAYRATAAAAFVCAAGAAAVNGEVGERGT